MKNILTYILLIFTLTSCLELLDDIPQSFERVYGSEGTSGVHGMIKRNNGHLLLYGREVKPAFKDGSDINIPFIIETDEFGNEIRSRNYAFYEAEYDMQLTSWDVIDPGWYGTNEFVTITSTIQEVKELSNGTFFCLGWFNFRPKNTSWPANYNEYDFFYLVLDENLEPIKWGLFNDTALEGPGRFFHNVFTREIYELPSGEIIFNSTSYQEYGNGWELLSRGFSIYKFSPLTEIIETWKYDSGNPDLIWGTREFVLGTDGSSLVVTVNQSHKGFGIGTTGGNFCESCEPSLFRIDLSSGEVLNTMKYNTRGLSFQVARHENGYVVKVYHPDPADSVGDGDRAWWGSLLFVNENLDPLKLVNITETNNILAGAWSFIQTRDGGYVAEFLTNVASGNRAVLIKTDRNGNVLWRYNESGLSQIWDIVEMDDGGIAYLVRRDYNGIGNRATLVKLTPDGKL